MGTPAAVLGDKLIGVCPTHLIPGPLGIPIPGPPMPFSGILTLGIAPTVLIASKPAVVMGTSGMNVPPHVGLHPADPFFAPPAQIGQVLMGSPTVLAGGRPLARTGSSGKTCVGTGTVVGTAATVLVA